LEGSVWLNAFTCVFVVDMLSDNTLPNSDDASPYTFEYWDKDKFLKVFQYKEFDSHAQDALRYAHYRGAQEQQVLVTLVDCMPHHSKASGKSNAARSQQSVTITKLHEVGISNAGFDDHYSVPHHVRLQPPKEGDQELFFLYKCEDTGMKEALPRNGWKRLPENVQKEMRRCYAQKPYPKRFNFEMTGQAYVVSDFHKVDDCQAYFQLLSLTGQEKRVRMNEEGIVQQKLCWSAFHGYSKDELLKVLKEGADINMAAEANGLTPLGWAVIGNHVQTAEDLVNIGADVNLLIRDKTTALTLALSGQEFDGTEMVRCLLFLGADPQQVEFLNKDAKDVVADNVSMSYWLDRASKRPITPEKRARLQRMDLVGVPRLEFAVVGQELAVRYIIQRIQGFYHPPFPGKPLIILALGPPGHGKTVFTRHLARSIASDDKLLEISCSSLKDDADLFGSRLGGWDSERSSKGQLISFLRRHDKERCVVLLDEFEKIRDLHSALGWAQDKKIYQSLLEPWQEGVITDRGAGNSAGEKISVSNKVFVLTSNIGQDKIIQFAEKHADKMSADASHQIVQWIQRELVKKELLPCLRNFFMEISSELQALVSRIDCIVPFMPFTGKEQVVVADMELRKCFAEYRKPPKMEGPFEERRPIGNLIVAHKPPLSKLASSSYDSMEGARSMQRIARDIHGKLVECYLDGVLDDAEKVQINKQHFSKVYVSPCDDTVEISIDPPSEPVPEADGMQDMDTHELLLHEVSWPSSINVDSEGQNSQRFERSMFAEMPRI